MEIARITQVPRFSRRCRRKDESQTKEHQDLAEYEEIAPLAKTHRKRTIKKEKQQKNQCQAHHIMKYSQISRQQIYSQLPEYVFSLIPSKKIFHLAGDILVEVEEETDYEMLNNVIFNEFRNIISIEQKTASISLIIESIKPMKILNQAIYELENSQNNDNYKFAQIIKKHQNTIFVIQNHIQNVIDSYEDDQDSLQKLLKEREAFMLQEKDKKISQFVQDEEFVCIASHMLSFAHLTTTMAHVSMTQASICMIGGKSQQLSEYLLHKGFFNVFNYASRRALFEVNMLQQQTEQESLQKREDYKDLEFEIPSIDICTLDNIHILTSCSISIQRIKYPPHLEFTKTKSRILNNIEAFIVIRQNITDQHRQTLQRIRDESQSSSSSFGFKDTIELSNLEYDAKCQVIMDKYYQEQCEELIREKNNKYQEQRKKTIESEKQPCKYRLI